MANTTVKLEIETRERLKAFGRKGETYDDLLNRMMDLVENHLGEWREKERVTILQEA